MSRECTIKTNIRVLENWLICSKNSSECFLKTSVCKRSFISINAVLNLKTLQVLKFLKINISFEITRNWKEVTLYFRRWRNIFLFYNGLYLRKKRGKEIYFDPCRYCTVMRHFWLTVFKKFAWRYFR